MALAAQFGGMRLGWYLAAQGAFGMGLLGSALRWHQMLRLNPDAEVHAVASVRMVFIGHFFNTFLGGPSGGDLPKTAVYSRWFGVPAAGVFAASILDRLTASVGGLAFVALALLAGGYSGAFEWLARVEMQAPGPWVLKLGGGVIAVLLVLAVVLVILTRRRRQSFLGRSLAALRQSVRKLVGSGRRSLRALGFAAFTASMFNLTQVLCLQAVSPEPVPLLKVLWLYQAVTVVAALPVTFAGAGLREGTAMFLLAPYGIPATAAVAGGLLTLSVHVTWALVGAGLLWREHRSRSVRARPSVARTISVVIPVFNEGDGLRGTVERLLAIPEITEILVVDGGSEDGTEGLARELGCTVVRSVRGRGQQLRAGAARASGDVVMMVSADTWLPRDAGAAVLRCLRDPLVAGGGFWRRFRDPRPRMRGARFRCWLRLWWGGRVSPDQAVFARRAALEAVGGVPDQPLMEDVELCRRLRRVGRLVLAGATVTASGRSHAVPVLRGIAVVILCLAGAVVWAADQVPARRTLVVLGDSLAAGHGLDLSESYPSILQKKVDDAGLAVEVVNGGVSGDTTAGGLRRLGWLMKRRVDVLVVALGGNDGLRGIAPEATRSNLVAIIDTFRLKQPGGRVVLAGMQMPPNMGVEYAAKFRDVFRSVAEERRVALVPHLLEGVGGRPELNQADQIHPTARGQEIVAENVWVVVKGVLAAKP